MNEPQSIALYSTENSEGTMALAKRLADSSLVPQALRGKPEDILLVLLMGQEMNIAPTAALRGFYVVQGRVEAYSSMLVGLCLRSGVCEYFRCVKTTDEVAIYETKRAGDPLPTNYEYSMKVAGRAGLTKKNPNYASSPAEMLRARCSAKLARMVYPDVCQGLYDPSEEHATVMAYQAPPPPVVEDVPVGYEEPGKKYMRLIENSTTTEELRKVATKVAALAPGEEKEQLIAYGRARREELENEKV